MIYPKFNIGESVIRQAQNYPEGNGIYTITSVITKQECEELYPNPFGWVGLDEIYYGLEGYSCELENMVGTKIRIISHHTAQGNLRKRHEKGEYSFNQLMNTLRAPEKVD